MTTRQDTRYLLCVVGDYKRAYDRIRLAFQVTKKAAVPTFQVTKQPETSFRTTSSHQWQGRHTIALEVFRKQEEQDQSASVSNNPEDVIFSHPSFFKRPVVDAGFDKPVRFHNTQDDDRNHVDGAMFLRSSYQASRYISRFYETQGSLQSPK